MDHLSDNELRQRLLQYGFPNLPITATTRKVLIKKLRNHMESEQAKLKQATSFVTRYSSDEDTSDRETKRHQRTTMPPPKASRKPLSAPKITNLTQRSQSVYVSPVVRHNMNTDSEDDNDHATTSGTNSLNSSFSNPYGTSPNKRSYTIGRTSSSLYPAATTSPSFISVFDRSNNSNVSQSREQTATSNGHSDDLFSDYSRGLSSHRRSAISTSTRKY